MTKALYPAPGQIRIAVTVTSIKRGRNFSTREVATNSVRRVSRDYKSKKVIQNAKFNAIYKHMHKGGNSTARVTEIHGFDFFYYDDAVIRKTVYRTNPRTKKRDRYAEVRWKANNKLVGRTKWRLAKNLE